MDFALSDEQRLLQDSVTKLFNNRYAFNARKRYMAEDGGFSHELWQQYAELGLLALPFAEEHGGIGGGPVETMIVMEQIGRALALEPYLATVVLAGGFIRQGGSDALQAEIIPEIAPGALTLAFAHAERQARYDLADVATTARADGKNFVLDGAKSLVLNGDSAKKFVVSARLDGNRNDRTGLGLFLVDAKAPGVSVRGYPTIDGLHAAEVTLSNVKVESSAAIGEPGSAFPLIERVADQAIAALAAEAVGAMTAMHETTVDYMKTRKQFGVTIGSFQVLQHRAVDMFTALEQARSMEYFAAMMATADNPRERQAAISAAKIQINNSARFLGQSAIQMHGGIGVTMEYRSGHYFKRLTMLESAFGDTDHHMHLLDKAGGLLEAA